MLSLLPTMLSSDILVVLDTQVGYDVERWEEEFDIALEGSVRESWFEEPARAQSALALYSEIQRKHEQGGLPMPRNH